MRDLKQDLAQLSHDSHDSHDSHGQPQHGYLNLTRRMENEEEDQFDCDLTILDFLVYKATGLVFEWRSSSDPFHSDLPSALVNMTADWRTFLAHKHHGRHLTPKAAFRSRLLQFALIFTHRLHHTETWTTPDSLASLQEQNEARGNYWTQRTSHPPVIPQSFNSSREFPLSPSTLRTNRLHLANQLGTPPDQRNWIDNPTPATPLSALLPVLLELASARVSLDDSWVPTSEWFDLLGQFLLHSVLEAYLLYGAHSASHITNIFAIGCPGTQRWAEEPSSVTAMRSLFCQETSLREEIPTWSNTRRKYIQELSPRLDAGESWVQAMQRAQRKYSYPDFERRVVQFLASLHEGVIKPDLAQVEEGRINIDGWELSEAESREAIRRMGL
ncbi:hypothetical protein T440DRAFT_467882 [Plenodomus tracheiphilus IPT5]|uniref:Uncharacterized protein n=1 Tax=Plenodomus tracheiphilus IPT5 TaxID=1408161 RepID=A0A6A7B9V7_9PLEO|nr:hypothetical protein T440DRAFT_467882 [Plenodomus tracheiphilus IPT5]